MVNLPSVGVVFNWRNECNKSELYSVHIRIKKGNIARYHRIPVPQKIKPNQWSGKDDAWVKANHPYAFEINCKIAEIKNRITDHIKRAYNFDRPITIDGILASLKNKGDNKSFLDFMQRYIQRPPEKLELGTIKKYRTTFTHFKAFRKNLFFSEIDNNLLRDFIRFMQMELNLGGAATKKYLEALKKIIKHAARENFISKDQLDYLFDGLSIKIEKAKRTFLDISEIKKWKGVEFTAEDKHLERDRDLFLLQVYTGYYYGDLSVFTKDQLQQDEEYGKMIVGARDKNGNQTIIPLFKFPHAENILNKYCSPVLEKRVIDPKYLIEEQVYNRHLKQIARRAGIHKNVSNKVARHTNAQLWIRYGAEGAVLSKMMGHTKQETTRNYYDVNLPEIVEGTKRVDFGAMGI